MSYHSVDMSADPRRAHFEYFKTMANPYVGITVEVDITQFLSGCKAKGYPFFLTFLYAVGRAANAVPQLRQRIRDGGVIEYDRCPTSHTVLREDGTYSYCELDCDKLLPEFLPEAAKAHAEAKLHRKLDDGDDPQRLFFLSCLPWVSYTAVVQPMPFPADSNPRITWGKYFSRDGKVLMPVTLLAHHALVDGIHLAAFYDALAKELHCVEVFNDFRSCRNG